jgi:hypothetical protein
MTMRKLVPVVLALAASVLFLQSASAFSAAPDNKALANAPPATIPAPVVIPTTQPAAIPLPVSQSADPATVKSPKTPAASKVAAAPTGAKLPSATATAPAPVKAVVQVPAPTVPPAPVKTSVPPPATPVASAAPPVPTKSVPPNVTAQALPPTSPELAAQLTRMEQMLKSLVESQAVLVKGQDTLVKGQTAAILTLELIAQDSKELQKKRAEWKKQKFVDWTTSHGFFGFWLNAQGKVEVYFQSDDNPQWQPVQEMNYTHGMVWVVSRADACNCYRWQAVAEAAEIPAILRELDRLKK